MNLIKFASNYADEFDVSGFQILTGDEWEELKQEALKYFSDDSHRDSDYGRISFAWYFGTNEELQFDSYEDWLNCIEVIPLDKIQTEVLHELFGYSYGITGPDLDFFLEPDWEEDDEKI